MILPLPGNGTVPDAFLDGPGYGPGRRYCGQRLFGTLPARYGRWGSRSECFYSGQGVGGNLRGRGILLTPRSGP